jgi:hypothetical protein
LEGRLLVEKGSPEGQHGIGESFGSSSSMVVLVGTWLGMGEGTEVGNLDGIRLGVAVAAVVVGTSFGAVVVCDDESSLEFCHLVLSGWYGYCSRYGPNLESASDLEFVNCIKDQQTNVPMMSLLEKFITAPSSLEVRGCFSSWPSDPALPEGHEVPSDSLFHQGY